MADETLKPEEAAPIITPEEPAPIVSDENETLKAELADYKFKDGITEVSKKYPNAREYQDDIKALVKEKGFSIEDATVVVLNKEGKLVTPPPARQASQGGSGFGGSMDNPPPRDRKAPQPGEPGAIEYWRDKFKEEEGKGGIRVV